MKYSDFCQPRGLRLVSTFEFLKANREFFINSDFLIIINAHADSGLGTYIVSPQIWEFYCHTDDHDLLFNMKDYYAFIDSYPEVQQLTNYKTKIQKTKWQLVWDNVDDKAVGLVSEYDSWRICGSDVDYAVDSRYLKQHETEALKYYHDTVQYNYMQQLNSEPCEFMRARYSAISVKLNEAIELFS